MKKTFAAVAATMTLCAFSSSHIPSTVITADDSYNLNVTVDLSGERLSISPLIYGINDAGYLDDATVNAVRQGGNRYTGYNWETNFSNAGKDYLHLSDTHNFDKYGDELSAKPGAAPLYLSKDAVQNGVDYKVATIQMAGYVAADADGEVSEAEAAPSSRWKEVKAVKGSKFSLTPDTTDDYVYMDEYVNYLVNTLGDSTTDTGIQAYNLDNEPGLWAETHPRLHPEPPTCDEIISKNIEYASAVKSIDPNAEIFGLTLYGYGTYLSFNEALDWESTYSSQYDWFLSCYLDKMAEAEEKMGKRLIDAVDLHYYSDAKSDTGCGITSCKDNSHTSCIEARLQATRSLYDETYMETSWISQWYSDYLPVLPTIRKSIDTYYPGTKHAISEYNFGGGDHISGAITQADALGIFASNNVYMAALWPLTANIEYQLSAIDLYTNYDGYGSSFGDTLVKSETSDIEKATCYAAIHGDDESKVNLVLTNKSMTETQNTVISLNSDVSYKSAAVYGITGDSSDIKLMKIVNDISDNTFSIELPVMSVVQIEISTEDYILKGDVNNSGSIENDDLVLLQEYLMARENSEISYPHSDIDSDGEVTVFDLIFLRKEIAKRIVPEETDVDFVQSDTAKWKIPDGLNGKTITCTLGGKPGYTATVGFGYWDSTLNDGTGAWIQDETTQYSITFDGNGEAEVVFEVPENATSLQFQVYYYAVYENGNLTSHDIAEVTLNSMTYH